MTIILHKPNVARARPSTLLNNNEEYRKLFNDNNSLKSTYNCALLLKIIDIALRKTEKSSSERGDLSFYTC